MVALASEVQASVMHRISFNELAETTGQTFFDLADSLKLSPKTLGEMEEAMRTTYQKKGRANTFRIGPNQH